MQGAHGTCEVPYLRCGGAEANDNWKDFIPDGANEASAAKVYQKIYFMRQPGEQFGERFALGFKVKYLDTVEAPMPQPKKVSTKTEKADKGGRFGPPALPEGVSDAEMLNPEPALPGVVAAQNGVKAERRVEAQANAKGKPKDMKNKGKPKSKAKAKAQASKGGAELPNGEVDEDPSAAASTARVTPLKRSMEPARITPEKVEPEKVVKAIKIVDKNDREAVKEMIETLPEEARPKDGMRM